MTDVRKMAAFRDVKLAEDFRKMAELGYVDEEYTMYGIVYPAEGKRHYLISRSELQIWEQVKYLCLKNIYPSPITHLSKICHVPLGEEEKIIMEVKLALACQLSDNYPLIALEEINEYYNKQQNRSAYQEIWEYCNQIEGHFSHDELGIARSLIEMGYIHKNLTALEYHELGAWLEFAEKNIENDIISKDILQKNWHSLLYYDQNGKAKLLTNARKEWAYAKTIALRQKGFLVSPIFSAEYWYNYQLPLETIKEQHEQKARQYLSGQCMTIIEKMFNKSGRDNCAINAQIAQAKALYGEHIGEMWQKYAKFMGVME